MTDVVSRQLLWDHLDQPTTMPPRPAQPEWGSDVVAELLRALQIEYIALNPGASFRGLHDSLINYNGNQHPGMILCNHEEVAVAVAHGYAKATGRPMAAALHTNIGLLHGSMSIFNAFTDHVPLLLLAGTGPLASTRRRPGVDWLHSSNGLGTVVREFVKWEHQPASVEAIPEAMLRAWHLAATEPCGPVLLTLDSGLLEEKLYSPVPLPDVSRFPLPSLISPPPEAMRTAAQWLTQAEAPVILLGETTQTQRAWDQLIGLAELLSAAVLPDFMRQASFPTNHFLMQASYGPTGRGEANEILRSTDAILALEWDAIAGSMRSAAAGHTDHYASTTSAAHDPSRPMPKLINVSLDHFAVSSWSFDFQELPPADLTISANVELTVAALLKEVRRELTDNPAARHRAEQRAEALRSRRRRLEAAWEERRQRRWDAEPCSIERTMAELKAAFGPEYEQVVLTRFPNTWVSGIWDFSRPKAYLGRDGGGGLGSTMAMAVGSALGLHDTGRPVVAGLGDGDALFASSALWTAAHHRLPVLFLVSNNASYYNDEEHQAHIARVRGRPEENRWVGQRLSEPLVDLATVARGLGVEGLGPITHPDDLAAACDRAVSVLRQGEPVLVDVRTNER